MGESVVNKKRVKCEVWSRVCGYLRPVQQWNEGKSCEFADRTKFHLE
jgi:ribonucleoside-triphosphate reductase